MVVQVDERIRSAVDLVTRVERRVEDAEAAAREWIMWRYLSNQAVYVIVMHDANQ